MATVNYEAFCWPLPTYNTNALVGEGFAMPFEAQHFRGWISGAGSWRLRAWAAWPIPLRGSGTHQVHQSGLTVGPAA
jgi:hypothetical protein